MLAFACYVQVIIFFFISRLVVVFLCTSETCQWQKCEIIQSLADRCLSLMMSLRAAATRKCGGSSVAAARGPCPLRLASERPAGGCRPGVAAGVRGTSDQAPLGLILPVPEALQAGQWGPRQGGRCSEGGFMVAVPGWQLACDQDIQYEERNTV